MKVGEFTKLHRKSGGTGHPSYFCIMIVRGSGIESGRAYGPKVLRGLDAGRGKNVYSSWIAFCAPFSDPGLLGLQ